MDIEDKVSNDVKLGVSGGLDVVEGVVDGTLGLDPVHGARGVVRGTAKTAVAGVSLVADVADEVLSIFD